MRTYAKIRRLDHRPRAVTIRTRGPIVGERDPVIYAAHGLHHVTTMIGRARPHMADTLSGVVRGKRGWRRSGPRATPHHDRSDLRICAYMPQHVAVILR
eukprot:scaffold133845_cov33-Tisochrysis_lutea.AAC.4